MVSSDSSSPEMIDDPTDSHTDLRETVLPVRPSPSSEQVEHNDEKTGESVPRPKRIACILCRKRKLRCDGHRPSCSTCSRLGHDCAYDEVRRKSGPKRGYVKLLEQRLKQVETLLETRDVPAEKSPTIPTQPTITRPTVTFAANTSTSLPRPFEKMMPDVVPDPVFGDPTIPILQEPDIMDDFSWEMIGLGLEEPLPHQALIDELTDIYFAKVHPSFPMIHRGRYYSSLDLAPQLRPPVCLRYAMWTHACSVTPKYKDMVEHFYTRARKYAELDEMKGQGENMIRIGMCQAWALIGSHEFKMMYFPRAWLSTGRADRLAIMLGLHRLDRVGLDVKQTIPPPADWTDREERRRTFWMIYTEDRYASIGSGWPMGIDERDILTNLPASEAAFNNSQPEQTVLLSDAIRGGGMNTISSFAAVVMIATIYGRNLTHLHRPDETDDDQDLNGAFWTRHRSLDNILLNFTLAMPEQLRMPAALSDANAIFVNMNLPTAIICLHQAAIFKAEKNQLPPQVGSESKRRCIVAADQIANHMRMISHLDMSWTNPFIAFCLYVAARVFTQYLKSRRNDMTVRSQLLFLIGAMQVLTTRNPLTESFLIQLEVDLEGSGLDIQLRRDHSQKIPPELPGSSFNNDNVNCTPLMEIRETQGVASSRPVVNDRCNSSNPGVGSSQDSCPSKNFRLFGSEKYPNFVSYDDEAPGVNTNYDGIENMYGGSQRNTGHISSPGLSSGGSTQSRGPSNHPTPASNPHRANSFMSFSPTIPEMNYTGDGNQAQSGFSNKNMTFNMMNDQMSNNGGNYESYNTANLMNMSTTSPVEHHSTPDLVAMGFTPNATTGMTPMADQLWQGNGMNNGMNMGMNGSNDWMYTWNGQTSRQ